MTYFWDFCKYYPVKTWIFSGVSNKIGHDVGHVCFEYRLPVCRFPNSPWPVCLPYIIDHFEPVDGEGVRYIMTWPKLNMMYLAVSRFFLFLWGEHPPWLAIDNSWDFQQCFPSRFQPGYGHNEETEEMREAGGITWVILEARCQCGFYGSFNYQIW